MRKRFKTVRAAVKFIERDERDWLIINYKPVVAKTIKRDLSINNLFHSNAEIRGITLCYRMNQMRRKLWGYSPAMHHRECRGGKLKELAR